MYIYVLPSQNVFIILIMPVFRGIINLITIVFFCAVCCNKASAQNAATGAQKPTEEIAFGGVVRDNDTKKSIPFATIVVRDTYRHLIDNVPSDNSGMFKSYFEKGDKKTVTVEIAMLGYESFIKEIEIKGGKKYYNLGIVFLKPNTQLQAIVVTAPQLIMPSPDGYVYNVGADSTAKNKRAVQLLAKLPFIELDEKNNPIYFGGSKRISYLVNGKTAAYMSNPKDVLKMVSGKKISSIELVPDPPPSFAGSDVVINIVTKEKKKLFEGLLLSTEASGSISKRDYSAGTTGLLTASTKNTSHNLLVQYDHNSSFKDHKTISTNEKIYDDGSVAKVLESVSDASTNFNIIILQGTSSYEISKSKQVAVTYGFNSSKNNTGTNTLSTYESDASGNNIYKGTNKLSSYSASAAYTDGSFRGRELRFKYDFNYSDRSNASNSSNDFSQTGNSSVSRSRRDYNTKDYKHSIASVFNIPIAKKQALTFNLNYDYTKDKNRNLAYSFNESDNTWEDVSGYPQRLENNVHSGSLKTSYTFKFKRAATLFLSGILSYYKNSGTLETDENKEIGYSAWHFQPFVRLLLFPAPGHNIAVIYQRTASHPSLYQLNPAADDSNPLFIKEGNPDLRDSKTDAFTATYIGKIRRFTYSASLFYYYTSNAINYFSVLGDDGITRSSYRNIGVTNSFSGKLSLSYLLTRNLTLKIGANYTHNMFRSDTTRRTNSISGNISCMYSITRRMKCLANLSFTPINSGTASAQQVKTYYMMASSFSISGSSKNMRFTWSLGITDFTDYRKYDKSMTEYRSSDNSGWYRSTVKSEIAGPVLSVSIGYIFGHAKGEK